MAALIMVIRHGEKGAAGGEVLNVDHAGRPDPDSLSVRGWMRAGALVGFFATPRLAGIEVPKQIHATRPTPAHPSKRSALTARPLADALGLALSLRFGKDEVQALWQQIQSDEGPVLVCWEHKAIPELARLILAGAGQAVPAWPEACYDAVWRFERGQGGAWHLDRIRQQLLPGDALPRA